MSDHNRQQLHTEAEALLDRQDMVGARRLYARICEAAPDDAQAWMMLGVIDGEAGRTDSALSALRTALDLDPGLADAHFHTAGLLANRDDLEPARACCQRAVELDPDYAEAWELLGFLQARLGQLKMAAASFQAALALAPDNIRALQALAELQLNLGQPDRCAATCVRLLALRPDDAQALSLLGTARQLMGQLNEASDALDRAAALQPGDALLHYKLACACQALGDLDRARVHFGRVLELDPGSALAVAGLVRVHEQQANSAELTRLLPALVEAADREPQVLPTLAAVAPQFGLEGPCLDKLSQALGRGQLPDALRSRLHWAAGRLHERLGNPDAAFEQHRQAKSLSAGRYDAAAHSAFIDRIIAAFGRDMLAAAPAVSHASELPVFIVGMPRSGTSLVEQILASHPRVFGAGELDMIARIAQGLPARLGSGRRFPECVHDVTREILDAAASDYLAALGAPAAKTQRVTDKMPHNFLYLGLIQMLFPRARVIHLNRDPLDTCISCFFQEFSHAHAYTRTLGDLGAHYRDYVRLMDHWRAVLRIPLLDLCYEDLVEEPERTMRAIVDFCGLPWDPACLEFHMTDRVVATLSASQVREPLNRKSIGKGRLYAAHLGPLIAALGTEIAR